MSSHPLRVAQVALIALVAMALTSAILSAQQLVRRPLPSRGISSFTFRSPSMGVRYGINLGFPPGYQPNGTRRYAALITTDGDQLFGGVYEAAQSVMYEKASEPLFVVSIGVELALGDSVWGQRRIYEF